MRRILFIPNNYNEFTYKKRERKKTFSKCDRIYCISLSARKCFQCITFNFIISFLSFLFQHFILDQP